MRRTTRPLPAAHIPRLTCTLTAMAAMAALATLAQQAHAAAPPPAPPASSPYHTDTQSSRVEDATSRGVNQVNMITCIMSALRPDALVNEGNYVALVDQTKCDTEARSSTSNAGSNSSGSAAPQYMNAVVNSERASNDVPMRARTWINEASDDFEATVFVNISASEAPTQANPYGVFRLDYCVKPNGVPGAGCFTHGFLEGASTGISYFENESDDGVTVSHSKALTLTTDGADGGAGVMSVVENGTPVQYSFAYNADYFRRSDGGSNDQCFSRDAADPDTTMSVWRYGLYDATTGERVTRNSGFPIEAVVNGQTHNGYMGYWGLSLPPQASAQLASGDTVTRVEYVDGQAPVRTDYTLARSGGRLVKYTKKTRTLADIDQIKFNTYIWDTTGFFVGAVANSQYELHWDNADLEFKVTGIMECGPSRCETRDLPSVHGVPASYFANLGGGVRGHSQALGGELFIDLAGLAGTPDPAAVNVIYRVQDLVYPSDMPPNLYCLRDCPTAATLDDFFSPSSTAPSPFTADSFNRWNPANGADIVQYTMDAASALLRDGDDNPIVMTDAEALQSRPQFQWGVRTGRLFTHPSQAVCAQSPSQYCDQQIEQLDVYYQWETGPNQWNQFAALKDGSGDFVTFDPPLQLNYQVPSGAAYGQYAGKDIVLQYGGFGDLWGIPGHCVSRFTNERVSCDTQDSRYVPAFVIPFDTTLGQVLNGSTALLAKWLDREIRFAHKDVADCTFAGVDLPSGLTLPSQASLQDPSNPDSDIYIGTQPTVTDPPRVIHGDVKY